MINNETKVYFRNICRIHLGSAISEIKSKDISDENLIKKICEKIEGYLERIYWIEFENWFFETYLDKVDKIRIVISIFQTKLLKEDEAVEESD